MAVVSASPTRDLARRIGDSLPILFAPLLLIASLHAPVQAWDAGGTNVTPVGSYLPAHVCADLNGGTFVVWSSAGVARAQHYNATGKATWTAAGVQVSSVIGSPQLEPIAIGDGTGGVVVIWGDARTNPASVYAQRLGSAGTRLWTAAGVALGTADSPFAYIFKEAISDRAGGAIAVWSAAKGGGTGTDLYAQRVRANGTIAWTAGGATVTNASGTQRSPSICSDGASGVIAAWTDYRDSVSNGGDIYAQRLDGTGVTQWTAGGRPVSTLVYSESVGPLLDDGSGGAYIVYGMLSTLTMQRVDALGNLLWLGGGRDVAFNFSGLPYEPKMVPSDSSGFFLVWSAPTTYGGTGGLDVQRLSSTGSRLWGNQGIRIAPTVNVFDFDLTPAGRGGAIVSWTDARGGASTDLYAQELDPDFGPLWAANGVLISANSLEEKGVVAVRTAVDISTVSWFSGQTLFDNQIHLQRVGGADLVADLVPSGWAAPLLPSSLNAFTCVSVPSPGFGSLHGNTADTYVNWGCQYWGPGPVPAWAHDVLLDESELLVSRSEPAGSDVVRAICNVNVGPFTIRGGRHSLTLLADGANAVSETSESNNRWLSQYVWTPDLLSNATPWSRAAPPAPGSFVEPNADGFRYSAPAITSWVVGSVPATAVGQNNLGVYSDPSFSARLSTSNSAPGETEFVVGSSGSPGDIYPAVYRPSAITPGDAFRLDAMDATGRLGVGTAATWPGQVLGPGRIVDVFELDLTTSQSRAIELRKLSGPGELAFEVHPATQYTATSRWGPGQPGSSYVAAADVDSLVYEPLADGRYAIVVFRLDASFADSTVTYALAWNAGGTVSAGGLSPEGLALAAPRPSPTLGPSALTYSLPRTTQCRIEIVDVLGKRIRLVESGVRSAGVHVVEWNGRTDSGEPVRAGLYWVVLQADGARRVRRIALL